MVYRSGRYKKDLWLDNFRVTGNITVACNAADVSRTAYYKWMERDEKFAMQKAQAEIEAVERLEEEARRRAIVGVDKPIFYKGAVVTTVKEYSDVLLIFLLKGLKPEKYRERIDINQTQPIVKVYEGVPWEQV